MTTKLHNTQSARASGLSIPTRPPYWSNLVDDFVESMARWQLWYLLGVNDIRQRYRRSRLGQFWITISMGAFVLTIGPVYAILFRSNIQEFLPYLTVNLVVWGFLASLITEGCGVFIQSDGYLRQE